MSLEQNKQVVRLYFNSFLSDSDVALEAFLVSGFNVQAIHGRYSAVIAPGGDEMRGPAMVRHFRGEWRTLWRDATIRLDEMVAEGDRVIAQWTFSGIHVGEFLGIPATNRRITYAGFNILRVADGKLAEAWGLTDRTSLFQQLGVLPPTRDILSDRIVHPAVEPKGT